MRAEVRRELSKRLIILRLDRDVEDETGSSATMKYGLTASARARGRSAALDPPEELVRGVPLRGVGGSGHPFSRRSELARPPPSESRDPCVRRVADDRPATWTRRERGEWILKNCIRRRSGRNSPRSG